MIIFNDLMNIMDEITNIYFKLYRLESLGEINGNYFLELVTDLKKTLIEEEELFNRFVQTSEYASIKDYVLNEGSPVFTRLKGYILSYESMNMKMDNDYERNLAVNLGKIYGTSSRNVSLIYLSFLQEYIETSDVIEIRDGLLNLKYYYAFTKLDIGKLLIENKFQISRINYVDYLFADSIKLDGYDSYDIILDCYLTVIIKMLKMLFSINDEQYKDYSIVTTSKSTEFMLRACFSLLSDSDYEYIKDDVFKIIDELSNDKNIRSGKIIDEILESMVVDRGRVRKVSLRPIIN